MHARHLPTRINTLAHMTSTTHTHTKRVESRRAPRHRAAGVSTPHQERRHVLQRTGGRSPRALPVLIASPPHSVTSSGGLFFDSLPLMTLGSMSPAFLARLIMTESEPTLGAAIGSLAPALAGVIIAYGESATS